MKPPSKRVTKRKTDLNDSDAPRSSARTELKAGRVLTGRHKSTEAPPMHQLPANAPRDPVGVRARDLERAALHKGITPDVPPRTSVLTRPPAGTFKHSVAGMEFMLDRPPRDVQADALTQVKAAFDSGKRFVILEGPPGCHTPNDRILLANGATKAASEVHVGDLLAGVEGAPRRVQGVSRGRAQMARIIPTKGEPFTVTPDHVLTLIRSPDGKSTRLANTLVDVTVRDWLDASTTFRHHHKLFRSAVNYVDQTPIQDLDPYFLGVLLGDGTLGPCISVMKPDREIRDEVYGQAKRYGMYVTERNEHYALSMGRGSKAEANPLRVALMELGLWYTRSGDKFVPHNYMVASRQERLQLLAGLIDTDGCLANGCYDYLSKSERLAKDVTTLARSLGLAAYLTPCEKWCQTGGGGTYYRVCLSGVISQIPCRIPRRQADERQQKKDVLRTGFQVEPGDYGDFVGFQVDGDNRYLMADFTVTHNCGKSAIAMTLANAMGGAYICTVTKQLQAQYLHDYEQYGARELKGRASFKCDRAGETCDVGGTLFVGEDACGISEVCPTCPYRTAKQIALESWATICNYHSYLYNIGVGGESEDGDLAWMRQLLILDEGHEIEKVLMSFVGVSINVNKLPVLVPTDLPEKQADGTPAPAKEYFKWLEVLLGRLKAEVKDMSPQEKTQAQRLTLKLLYLFKHRESEEWIIEPWQTEHGSGFEVKPLTVNSFGERMFKYGRRVLIMSATILDAEAVAQSIGVPLHQFAFVRAPCIFPKENRPIYVGNLAMQKSARFSDDDPQGGSWPRMIGAVASILRHHPKEKGLILTPSIEMLKFIRDELAKVDVSLSKRLTIAYGSNRVNMYGQHLKDRGPSVLAAAGFWEGVDLSEDASRFQIIPALPRPIWQGQIQARAKLDPRWYKWLYLCQLVQGVGRSVRSETDSAVTYVLDAELRREMRNPRTILPPWFVEACKEIN